MLSIFKSIQFSCCTSNTFDPQLMEVPNFVLLYPSCSVRGKRLCRHTVYHFPFSKLPGEGLSFFHSFIHLLRLIEANMKGHLSPLFVWFFSSVSSFFLPGSGVPLRRMANDITWVGTRNISADTSESRLLEPRWNVVYSVQFPFLLILVCDYGASEKPCVCMSGIEEVCGRVQQTFGYSSYFNPMSLLPSSETRLNWKIRVAWIPHSAGNVLSK